MSLDAYQRFWASPTTAALADDASLLYTTSATSFSGATAILKHLAVARKQVRVSHVSVLDSAGAATPGSTLAAELETALEFVTSGGVYAPGLDDNFVTDRRVVLPMTHFVSFDAKAKISRIRLAWDQGALLKALEIIGKTGRNWPIHDTTEQLRVIRAATSATHPPSSAASTASANDGVRSRGSSILAAGFGSREELESPPEHIVSPRGGNRPRQRSFVEILGDNGGRADGDGPNGGAGASAGSAADSASPPRPTKAGAGKHFAPTRLFDTDDDPAVVEAREREVEARRAARRLNQSPVRKSGVARNFQPSSALFHDDQSTAEADAATAAAAAPAAASASTDAAANQHDNVSVMDTPSYRPNPKMFNHFDFADGSDPQDAPRRGVDWDAKARTRHDSQWSFDDFVSPVKPAGPARTTSAGGGSNAAAASAVMGESDAATTLSAGAVAARPVRQHDIHHWSTEPDAADLYTTPARRAHVARPRRDAETHFVLQDDGMPAGERRLVGRPKGTAHNEGLGLYQNNVFSDSNDPASRNGNGDDRLAAPSSAPSADAASNDGSHAATLSKPLGNITNLKDRSKDFSAHFRIADDSPSPGHTTPTGAVTPRPKVNPKAVRIMDASWSNYDTSPVAKENAGSGSVDNNHSDEKQRKIYHTTGDGMGGRKDVSAPRAWSIGDDSDDEHMAAEAASMRTRTPGAAMLAKQKNTSSSIWDVPDQE